MDTIIQFVLKILLLKYIKLPYYIYIDIDGSRQTDRGQGLVSWMKPEYTILHCVLKTRKL